MPFDPSKMNAARRRKEHVENLAGGDLWVWEMTVAEGAIVMEQSARPPQDPRGGADPTTSLVLQIQLACYDGREEGANQVFRDDQASIFRMSWGDSNEILAAIARVNGRDPEEVRLLQDFTVAR